MLWRIVHLKWRPKSVACSVHHHRNKRIRKGRELKISVDCYRQAENPTVVLVRLHQASLPTHIRQVGVNRSDLQNVAQSGGYCTPPPFAKNLLKEERWTKSRVKNLAWSWAQDDVYEELISSLAQAKQSTTYKLFFRPHQRRVEAGYTTQLTVTTFAKLRIVNEIKSAKSQIVVRGKPGRESLVLVYLPRQKCGLRSKSWRPNAEPTRHIHYFPKKERSKNRGFKISLGC